MKKTHLINQFGEKKIITTRDVALELKRLNESTNSTYTLDVDWYLNNGYSLAEDVFRRIESHGDNQ